VICRQAPEGSGKLEHGEAKAKVDKPYPGQVVMVTGSSGTEGFLGIPNLKNMIYENRMTYAHKWGESR